MARSPVHGDFDPYHKWLGIPPKEQPPDHYRLLALPVFESDPEVIESAADQRMGHVRTFQTGRHSALSQRILNELAAARVCLLSPGKKAVYDRQLKEEAGSSVPQPVPPVRSPHILPSPPPPIFGPQPPQPSHEPVVPDFTSPSGPEPDLPSPLFAPMEPTLPDPITPVPRPKGKTGTLPLIATGLGVALLLLAGGTVWYLYREQTASHVPVTPAPSPSATDPSPEEMEALPAPVDEEAVPEEQPVPEPPPAAPVDAERADLPVELPPEPQIPPSSEVDDPPPDDPPVPDEPPRSLGDLIETTDADPSDSAAPDEDEDDTSEKADDEENKKWRRPRRDVIARRLGELQNVIASSDFNGLLEEAQNAELPPPDVYVLLGAAHDKAVLALNAEVALQAIDSIESKFNGSYDDKRVSTLQNIGNHLRSSRQFRDLGLLALQVSEDAQSAENKRLARAIGVIALRAAERAQDADLQSRVKAHLDGL